MTTEELIEVAEERLEHLSALAIKTPCLKVMKKNDFDFLLGVISALRAQQTPTKLDRSRWEGCDSCENQKIKQLLLNHRRKYCSVCGRPLTEEAWAELEKKLEV